MESISEPSRWLDSESRGMPESARWWFPDAMATDRRAVDLVVSGCGFFTARASRGGALTYACSDWSKDSQLF
jgi:hypothetical protein